MRSELLTFVLATAPLCAQTQLLVGPGGFPEIRAALAAASPGDTLYVAAGTYAHFTCSVPVSIRAITPGTVFVQHDLTYTPPACLFDLNCIASEGPTRFEPPAGQSVQVSGVNFVPNVTQVSITRFHHRVIVSSGTVSFDRCAIEATDRKALEVNGLASPGTTVHLQSCVVAGHGSLAGAPHGLTADTAHVIAVDTEFAGGDASFGVAGDAVTLHGSTFRASGCELSGGSTIGGVTHGPAIRADRASRIWISDSTLAGGSGDCAILGSPNIGQIARSTVIGTNPGCGSLATAPLVGVERPAAIATGTTFSVHVHTEPSVLVVLHGSPRLGFLDLPDLFQQPLSLDVTSFFVLGFFASDQNGDVSASWNMPAGQYLDETVWVEPMAFLPTSILVGPPVGGLIH